MISVLQGSKAGLILEKILSGEDLDKKEVKNKVTLWTTYIKDRRSFDILLHKILESGATPNIFIG